MAVQSGKIMGICISPERGTQKENIHHARLIENFGIENDAHAGDWHRQVSLLSYESIQAFNDMGAGVLDGAFGENLIISGLPLTELPIGTRLGCGDSVLEVTQIGKECHSHCQIYRKMGDCIMPRQGIFTKVLRGGEINEGDEVRVLSGEA